MNTDRPSCSAADHDISRRDLLRLIGVAATAAAIPRHGEAATIGPTPWVDAPATGKSLETLGTAMLISENPYYDPKQPKILPQKYAKGDEWKSFIQEDADGATWTFRGRTTYVRRIVRIPYFVSVNSLYILDYMLVGYAEPLSPGGKPKDPTVGPAPDPGDYWVPASGGTYGNDFETVGAFLMYERNPFFSVDASGMPSVALPANWPRKKFEHGKRGVWPFRDVRLRVDDMILVPYRVQEDGQWMRSALLVGWEGAGGY